MIVPEGMIMTLESETAGPTTKRHGAIHELVASLTSVFRSRNLRRMQLALAGSMIGDWAYSTAIIVWAYGVGGATAVGLFAAVRLLLMAIVAPFAAGLADRYPRKAVMIASDLLRVVLVVAAALCLYADTHPAPVFVLAGLASLVGTAFRPAQMAWVPSLADDPRQLAASNGAASTIESLSFFLGPALGAALVAATDVPTVLLVNAVTFLWSAVLVSTIRPRPVAATPDADDGGDEPTDDGGVLAGFRQIRDDPGLVVVATLVTAQTVVAGASAVFAVLFAVEYLGLGPEGVGYVDSAFGAGAIVGGLVAISRAARNRLAADLGAGTFLWSAPLLLVAVWPHPVTVIACVLVLGFANPLVDVNFATIVQRIAPERTLGRVFGALEGLLIGGMAGGAAIMPFLVDWLGLRGALVVIALLALTPVLLLVRPVVALDQRLVAPEALPLLRGLPMFAPLSPSRLDQLARQAVSVTVPAGSVVVSEGEESARFYVIESGSVEVTRDGLLLRHEGPGDFFGEIGLLRDVVRTATVTAADSTRLWAIDRQAFLDAVTGNTDATTATEDVVSRRLAF